MRSASAKSPESMRLALATLLALASCKDDSKPAPSRPASTTSAAVVSSPSATPSSPVTAPPGTVVFVSERVSPKAVFSVSTVGAPKPALIARSDDDVFPAVAHHAASKSKSPSSVTFSIVEL